MESPIYDPALPEKSLMQTAHFASRSILSETVVTSLKHASHGKELSGYPNQKPRPQFEKQGYKILSAVYVHLIK